MDRNSKKSAKVYVDSTPAVTRPGTKVAYNPNINASKLKPSAALRLSHDISTEQLLSDQLVDENVNEDDDDDDDEDDHKSRENNAPNRKPDEKTGAKGAAPVIDTAKMYRIESHSALSSLEATNLEKELTVQPAPSSPQGHYPQKVMHQRLVPLPGSPTARSTDTTSTTTAVSSPPSSPSPTAPPTQPTGSNACEKCFSNKEMPAMHFAAYSGHTKCLAAFLEEDLDPQKLDKKRRTPLFYSCAANRIDCCELLLTKRMDWRDLPDKQLDTPVHVCCFFGWHQCLQHLLNAGANPHGRNAKGFKPSHIAKTKECLELLLSYGDDLLQGDKLGRTPLFVACARDRSVCVEFLCTWNHQTHSWMLEQEDQRGDRPIHAAACNGSVASLEVLLRYGADPTIANGKGMTPKDLAIANNHQPCVDLLEKAERELASADTWFAPANAVEGMTDGADPQIKSGWIECWDSETSQPFYYNNVTGKCQWEVPEGFTPHFVHQVQQHAQQQQQQQQEEDDGEYVWVKKKKQAVCVVTGKDTEWEAVQDPASKAIYYKNTRTGQSQWEEPDAILQLQSASSAQASQEASRLWEELEGARGALSKALAAEKHRQLQSQLRAIEQHKHHLRERHDDMKKREEQAKLQQLLPRSSFIRRKKQSMMMKIKQADGGSGQCQAILEEEEKLDAICAKEPALDIFLSTYLRLNGVRDLKLTAEKRFFNCLFHYYVALVDPILMGGISKSQFRVVLRDANIIPSSATSASLPRAPSGHQLFATPPLKLHIIDLAFGQAARADAIEGANSPATHSSSHSSLAMQHHRQLSVATSAAENHLSVAGFITAMQLIRERVVAQAEELMSQGSQQTEIEDDEEWFLTTFILPLTIKLGGKMLTHIRECKELDLEVTAAPKVQAYLSQNRVPIQALHRYYTSQEPKMKMLTFRGLSVFAQDFDLVTGSNMSSALSLPSANNLKLTLSLPNLHQLYEAVNWISGNAHTEIISFEKFQQILTILAVPRTTPLPEAKDARDDFLLQSLVSLFTRFEANNGIHRVRASQAAPSTTIGISGTDNNQESVVNARPSDNHAPFFALFTDNLESLVRTMAEQGDHDDLDDGV